MVNESGIVDGSLALYISSYVIITNWVILKVSCAQSQAISKVVGLAGSDCHNLVNVCRFLLQFCWKASLLSQGKSISKLSHTELQYSIILMPCAIGLTERWTWTMRAHYGFQRWKMRDTSSEKTPISSSIAHVDDCLTWVESIVAFSPLDPLLDRLARRYVDDADLSTRLKTLFQEAFWSPFYSWFKFSTDIAKAWIWLGNSPHIGRCLIRTDLEACPVSNFAKL